MFDFLIPLVIFGVGGYFTYKTFELYAMRKERRALIERLDNDGLIEYVRRTPIGVGFFSSQEPSLTQNATQCHLAMWPMRCGCLLLGIGAGLVAGYLFTSAGIVEGMYRGHFQFETVYGACTCIGAGVGLIIAFVIEIMSVKRRA